ncbi:iron transporter [Streptomyces sp. NPDC004111]
MRPRTNPHGFGEGDWVPYLTVSYTLNCTDA